MVLFIVACCLCIFGIGLCVYVHRCVYNNIGGVMLIVPATFGVAFILSAGIIAAADVGMLLVRHFWG